MRWRRSAGTDPIYFVGPSSNTRSCGSPDGIRIRVSTLRGSHPGPLDDGALARGEGLEPSITGPEPVVLPITPPPIEWRPDLILALGPGMLTGCRLHHPRMGVFAREDKVSREF